MQREVEIVDDEGFHDWVIGVMPRSWREWEMKVYTKQVHFHKTKKGP